MDRRLHGNRDSGGAVTIGHGLRTAWLTRRLLIAMPVVAGITIVTFVLIHLAPGDPIYALAGDGGSPAYYAEMRARYGLDQPLLAQLATYVSLLAAGDLGYSFMFQAPVARVLLDHLGSSLLLGLTALLIAVPSGVTLGVWCAVNAGSRFDAGVRVASAVLYAAPVYWTGQVLMLLFALRLGLLPVGGMTSARASLSGWPYLADVAWHLILPAIVLALPFVAVMTSVVRASMIGMLHEPFVSAAVARGAARWAVIVRHAAPNAAPPVAAVIGQHAAEIVAGAALTESLFGWPGIGYLVLHASLHRDYPLVTGAFILVSAGVVVVNLVTDITCAWMDPRARLA